MLKITIKLQQPTLLNLWRVKRYDELTHPLDLARYDAAGIDQFGYRNIYVTDAAGKWVGTWSNNGIRSYLTSFEMAQVAAMQIPDEATREAKMQWFTYGDSGTTGAPMISTDWTQGAWMIVNFYPGMLVNVLEERDIYCDWMDVKGYVRMSRLQTFSRADFGKTHYSHSHLIHKVTAVGRDNNYREQVKGTVYSPVALGSDFTMAGFRPAAWWIFTRQLIKV